MTAIKTSNEQVITDAYIYMLSRYLVIRQENYDINVEKAGWNEIKYNPLGSAEFVNPNMDVAYLEAWIAIDEKTPAILSVPDIKGRYYTAQILDEWGEVTINVNERITSDTPYGDFAFILKGTNPEVPAGSTPIELPSKKAKMLARVELQKTKDEAVKLQKAFKLSSYGTPTIAPPITIPAFTNEELIGVEIFDKVDEVLGSAPDVMPIAPELQEKARQVAAAISDPAARESANKIIREKSIPHMWQIASGFGVQKGGWSVSYTAGNYEDLFDIRAIANLVGIWANNPGEVIYFIGDKDANGDKLSGDSVFEIRFNKDSLPQDAVDAFWSLTCLTASDYRVVPNRLNRYSVSVYSDFEYEKDGSLRLVLASELPDGVPEANWLPTAAGKGISLNLRMYVPKGKVLDGTWFAPPITKAK